MRLDLPQGARRPPIGECDRIRAGGPLDSAGDMSALSAAEDAVKIGRLEVSVLHLATAAAALVVFTALLVVDFNPPDADVRFDWLATREAWRADGNAHADILELADRYKVPIELNADPAIDITRAHPRTPGALALQTPILAIPINVAFALASFISVLCLSWLALVRQDGTGPVSRPIALLVVLMTAPAFLTLRFASQTAIVAVAVLLGWIWTRQGRQWRGGVLIGIAATLKVFPLVLLVPILWHRKWKAAAATVATVIGCNLVGLALPGVSLANSVHAMSDASALWRGLFTNGSLFRIMDLADIGQTISMVVSLAVFGVGAIVLLGERRFATPFGWLALALLVAPLTWMSYDLVLVPGVVVLVGSRYRFAKSVGILVLILWLTPILLPWLSVSSGLLSLVSRLLVLGIAAYKPETFLTWSIPDQVAVGEVATDNC